VQILDPAPLHAHTLSRFDTDLEAVRSLALEMGGLVEQQVQRAVDAFVTGDLRIADEVIARDRRVNAMQVSIDEECTTIIALRHPTAGDLRLLITIGRIITDLERIGDEADKIARMVQLIYDSDHAHAVPHIELRHIADVALDMLDKSLAAFARLDTAAAVEVLRKDGQVDDEYRCIIRQMVAYMMSDADSVAHGLEILFAAKAVERIGDHAKNVAEYVIYLVKGKDVRHVSMDEVEREVAGALLHR
jgi:phosphate transport system protein